MKLNFVAALLVLACALTVRADNVLQNGDFSDGFSHWYGDGRPPSDFAPSDPLEPADPVLGQGLIVPLKDMDWCKVAQDFNGKIISGKLTISYKVTQDCTFSAKPDDYANVSGSIGYNLWLPFKTAPKQWVVFISDIGDSGIRATYYTVTPKFGTTETQNFQTDVSGLTPNENKTLTFAFPPGTGKVVIVNVSLTN